MRENWQIYGIFDKKNDELIYIGQTRHNLSKRWSWHISWSSEFNQTKINSYMRQNGGYDNFKIVRLQDGYKTLDDALEWENHLILEFDPKCNIRR